MKLTRKSFDTVKFGWEQRNRRTPVRLKKLGDALLAAFGSSGIGITTFQMIGENPNKTYLVTGVVFMVLGALGKFLSILFGEDTEVKNEELKEKSA